MDHDTDIVALVGAGEHGRAIIAALLGVPGVEVRYVFDADPAAPGIALAREKGIRCRTDGRFDELSADADVDLIIETTGRPETGGAVQASRRPASVLLDAAGARFVAHLLDALTDTVEREKVEKARYIRQASHQLKSPLSAIQSYVNVILGGYTGEIPERTREIMEKIHSRCDAALAALDERRALAGLRSIDRDGLEVTSVHLAELIDQAIELHAAPAGRRGIEIRFARPEGSDLVRCDPARMLALLSAIIRNAVVYSRDGGLIEISLTARSDGTLVVSVRDHGIGIPARCLPRIFDEDYRADPAVRHNPAGAGLGLTIAREIADLHGFHLGVESQDGGGSLFTVSVPAAPTT